MAKLRSTLTNLALLGVSLVAALVIAEWAVGWLIQQPPQRRARHLGVAYDDRDRLLVVLANRREDPNWFPAVPVNTYLENNLSMSGQRVVPLGGVAHARVVGCNENGYHSTFATDEYGFNNPHATWRTGPSRRIYFLGDSYTQGDCLRQGETIVDQLRQTTEGVINLGSGGNGPLLELAGIREYVADQSVEFVFWMYYEGNDLADLNRDRRDPILVRYLDGDFSQQLRVRQSEVNAAVRSFVEARLMEQEKGRAVVFPRLRTEIWKARQRLAARSNGSPGDEHHDVTLFGRVISQAKTEVERKGGRLVVVYLPEYHRFSGGPISATATLKPKLLQALADLRVPVIDVEERFRRHKDPTMLFPFQINGHYNVEGAREAARAIDEFLRTNRSAASG